MGRFESNLMAQVGWSWQTGGDQAPVVDTNRLWYRKELADGREAFQADGVWHVEGGSLGQAESVIYDLRALAFEIFGDEVLIGLEKVRAVAIVHQGDSPGVLEVGGAETAAWPGPLAHPAHKLHIPAHGAFWAVHPEEGWPVSTDAHRLRLAALGGPVVYDIVLLGNRQENSSSS